MMNFLEALCEYVKEYGDEEDKFMMAPSFKFGNTEIDKETSFKLHDYIMESEDIRERYYILRDHIRLLKSVAAGKKEKPIIDTNDGGFLC